MPARLGDIKGDAALAGVEISKAQTALAVRVAVGKGRLAARGIPARRLDLDDVHAEIAETLALHESTVSRVTTQKFMLTPRGIFELMFFFGSHVTTETGGSASSTAIRALIKQLVSAENGKKPLSDSQISEILSQQGIVVARRTIAKYRESMQILPVNLRKSI